ncbi:unconventional myosin-XV [Lepeophtheirus salmonis]|uniref:unconventional myosin-XV n=1 Tax=Lepeophtheirus salmonis TaxID=72036 RepID=UPI001AE476CE|nr:unconventional myosin-XV-like [Lepeophtheirus salmonis]
MYADLKPGDLVWFDPGVGYVLPGEVLEYHESAQVIMVQAIINSVTKNFTLNNLSSVRPRQDLGQNGVEDMITLRDINEASILWNLRIRYDNHNIYTYIGTILISVNPYRTFDDEGESLYGLKSVNKYDGQILGTLSPHLFAIGSAALARQVTNPKKNVVILLNGESGSGKTECSKLLLQYLSAVNKSSSNLKTEQIIEGSNLLESFGHARTVANNNSSRFGKFIQIYFKDGVISGAKFNEYLLEKHRIVSHNSEERNFHIFYELLAGLSKEQKEKYGLMTVEKYFYLNQGQSYTIDGKNDRMDFENLISSFQVLGFTLDERESIFKVLSSVLHLGNVYFNRKHFRNGVEGVDVGSNVEIKWAAHLLQLNSNDVEQVLTSRLSPESLREPIIVPMNIDQALDVRDALSKAVYSALFSWIVKRTNKILSTKSKGAKNNKGICILDLFGFEDQSENSFEQLCINFANEQLNNIINKRIFKVEQAEYHKEQIEWTPINYCDNGLILNILSKKPVGIFHLLDDESNFPKANDTSFLDKCHYNHALNELYSRPRMSSREFGVKHFAGQVWYNVDGFLKKNRDLASFEIVNLLSTTKNQHLNSIFSRLNPHSSKNESNYSDPRSENVHLVTMKPRAPTVSARFIDNLNQLLSLVQDSYPFYVLCINPNTSKLPSKFDMPLVLEQLRVHGVVETIMIRKTGYPIRMKYKHFVERFRCLLGVKYPKVGYYGGGTPTTKEMARNVVEKYAQNRGKDFEFGSTKVFLKENLRKTLETERRQIHDVTVIKLQRAIRGYLARKDYVNMKKSTIKIQAAYRGWIARREYCKARKGVIALQAIYRMQKQKSIYQGLLEEKEIQRKLEEEEEEERRKRRAEKAEAKIEDKLIRIERARLQRKKKMSEDEPIHMKKISRESIKKEYSSRVTSPSSNKSYNEDNYFDYDEEDVHGAIDNDFDHQSDEIVENSNSLTLSELGRTKSASNNHSTTPLPPKLSLALPSPPPLIVSSPPTKSNGHPMGGNFVREQSVNHLEIPAELAFIMSKAEKSGSLQIQKNLGKITEPLVKSSLQGELKLPSDIDYYSFSKVANIYFKYHLWEMKSEAIKTPFLSKTKESDYQDSIAIFKLILRFMNDPNMGGSKEKILSDYIVNKGIKNEKLRDEIYCQLANQTRKNDDEISNERGWFLLSNCLSAFLPSRTLYKYLLKYVSDNAVNGYKYVCQQKLLQGAITHESRIYPPTNLEWRSNKKCVKMALDATFPDFEIRPVSLDSYTTAEEFAANALTSRGVSEISGWTVGFEKGDGIFELNGSDFVLDILAEGELPSVFPKAKLPFLQIAGELKRHREQRPPMPLPTMIDELENIPVSNKKRSHSEDRVLSTEEFGLSSGSVLNNRYFENNKESRSKSLDNLLNPSSTNNYGLSENSPLNQRYKEMTKTDSLTETLTKEEWQKIGLSQKNAMNDRYFSHPDLLDISTSPIGEKELSSTKPLTQSNGNLRLNEELEMAIASNKSGNNMANGGNLLKKGRPRFVKGRRSIKHSSAMSDTSEAPSIASHVRRVRVPSQASDVDQFLDDLFMPVLDVDDGLSDAKSLAASMRGGGKKFKKLTQLNNLVGSIKGSRDTENNQSELPPPPPPLPPGSNGFNSSMGFHPIPGVVSPTMSPPPMLMPTPVQGSFMNQPQSNITPTMSQDGSALAFTYVPVPVYNMGGIGLPGMMTPKPQEPMMPSSNNATPTINASYQQAFIQNAVAQNMQIQQQLMMQNQALSQLLSQAISSPQPTSLTSMYSELKINPGGVDVNQQPYDEHQQNFALNSMNKIKNEMTNEYVQESKTTPTTPKMSTASTMEMEVAGFMDSYMRAGTVRIGKWRWPPPKEEMENGESGMGQNEGFFEFKLRKMQEKLNSPSRNSLMSPNSQLARDQKHFHDQMEQQQYNHQQQQLRDQMILIQNAQQLQLREQQINQLQKSQHQEQMRLIQNSQKLQRGEMRDNINQKQIAKSSQQQIYYAQHGQYNDIYSQKADEISHSEWDTPDNSIHKLKLSKEVKNRLEAAVIKNHSKDENGKLELSELEIQNDDDKAIYQQVGKVNHEEIQKLTENRKNILEKRLQKLKKWSTMDGVDKNGNLKSEMMDNIPPPPPLPFVFPGSLSTKTGEKLRGKYGTEDFFESSGKNRFNSTENLSQVEDFHEDDYQSVDEVTTKLHPPNSVISYMYTRNVPWNLNIRKELFSPSESLCNPLVIHLIFSQIANDILKQSKISNLRLNRDERIKLKSLLNEYSITLDNLGSTKHRLSTKKNIIDVARDCDHYFSRLYPVSSGVEGESQFLSISHKGVRLVRRSKNSSNDYLETIETYTFEDIGEISTVKSSGLQIVTHTGGRLFTTTPKASVIKDLLNTYLIEANASHYDYVKALGDFNTEDENALSFKKGDIIAVVAKKDPYTEKGWLYGIKDGSYGLIPGDFVNKLSPKSIRREMRIIANITQRSKDHETEEDEEEEKDMHPTLDVGLERHTDDDEDDEGMVKMDQRNQYSWDKHAHTLEAHNPPKTIKSELQPIRDDGKHPLLEFALQHFQESLKIRTDIEQSSDKKNTNKKKGKSAKKSSGLSGTVATNDWTWKDQVDLVKWTPNMISNSLLRLEAPGHNNLALECFACIMRVMGDLPLLANQHEVDCVNTLLMYCHRLESIRDEVYCQIMKQTTNNKSISKDSCQKGWRLFTIVAAYFSCTEVLKPYLFKYLESAAYDKRRAYHGTALVCLHNLRKTFRYGGRKNVPSIEEITAIVAGRSSKRQIYRLPGGTERIINTKSTTVVADIIDELCNFIGVESENEKEEFSLYCIIEGELYTLPLSNRHYILDLTNGLQHQNEEFYLIFCRSVWHYPLRIENQLYIEVVFNQIAPDYLEGHLIVLSKGILTNEESVDEIAKIAAFLHKAADMNEKPSIKETKFLLPKPILSSREIKPPQWVSMVQNNWKNIEHLTSGQAKGQVLQILSNWPLFGSSFFAVTRVTDGKNKKEEMENLEEELLALNKHGVSFLDQNTHETLLHYSFTEVISTRKVELDEQSFFLDMKCGNLMSQKITRIKTFQADEIARLIRQYISIDQKLKAVSSSKNTAKRQSRS